MDLLTIGATILGWTFWGGMAWLSYYNQKDEIESKTLLQQKRHTMYVLVGLCMLMLVLTIFFGITELLSSYNIFFIVSYSGAGMGVLTLACSVLIVSCLLIWELFNWLWLKLLKWIRLKLIPRISKYHALKSCLETDFELAKSSNNWKKRQELALSLLWLQVVWERATDNPFSEARVKKSGLDAWIRTLMAFRRLSKRGVTHIGRWWLSECHYYLLARHIIRQWAEIMQKGGTSRPDYNLDYSIDMYRKAILFMQDWLAYGYKTCPEFKLSEGTKEQWVRTLPIAMQFLDDVVVSDGAPKRHQKDDLRLIDWRDDKQWTNQGNAFTFYKSTNWQIDLDNHDLAIFCYLKAKSLNPTNDEIDVFLGVTYLGIAEIYGERGHPDSERDYMRLAANCDNEDAIKWLKNNRINIVSDSSALPEVNTVRPGCQAQGTEVLGINKSEKDEIPNTNFTANSKNRRSGITDNHISSHGAIKQRTLTFLAFVKKSIRSHLSSLRVAVGEEIILLTRWVRSNKVKVGKIILAGIICFVLLVLGYYQSEKSFTEAQKIRQNTERVEEEKERAEEEKFLEFKSSYYNDLSNFIISHSFFYLFTYKYLLDSVRTSSCPPILLDEPLLVVCIDTDLGARFNWHNPSIDREESARIYFMRNRINMLKNTSDRYAIISEKYFTGEFEDKLSMSGNKFKKNAEPIYEYYYHLFDMSRSIELCRIKCTTLDEFIALISTPK